MKKKKPITGLIRECALGEKKSYLNPIKAFGVSWDYCNWMCDIACEDPCLSYACVDQCVGPPEDYVGIVTQQYYSIPNDNFEGYTR